VQVTEFPVDVASVKMLDNLNSDAPMATIMATGKPLKFEIQIAERSSYTIVVEQFPANALYLPIVLKHIGQSTFYSRKAPRLCK
jgi:hypothetical protein